MDERNKMLVQTINKLHRRGADRNIKRILDKSHSADVASILEGLDLADRHAIFQLIPNLEKKADTLSRLNREMQKELAVLLGTEEIKAMLKEMESDDAADLLGFLPEDLSKEILRGLKEDELQDVEELMSYPEDSAGGIMSSEVLFLQENQSLKETIQVIQDSDEDLISFYIYVVNEVNQLVGVLSLKQVLLAKPSSALKDVMSTDVICVDVSTSQEDVARIVEKYDFLSLPVVDGNNKLVGVITVDDVIDVIKEEAADDFLAMGMAGISDNETVWDHVKSRVPWLFLAFLCGLCIDFMAYFWLKQKEVNFSDYPILLGVCFHPLSLLLISIASNQTATLAVGSIREGLLGPKKAVGYIRKEMGISLVLASIFAVTSFALLFFTIKPVNFSYLAAGALWFQIMFSAFISSVIPILLNKMNFNPAVSSVPFAVIFSSMLATAIMIVAYLVAFS